MTLTRATVETIIVRRCGRLLTACALDGTTIDGTNADLSDPIALAVKQLGGAVANRASVADADLAGVADADEEALLDLAELRALESALQNFDAVDVTAGPETEKYDQLGKRLEAAIARKRKQVQAAHGLELSTLSAGVIDLGFQQQIPLTADDADL